MLRQRPFDAVLIVAFGGPEGPDQIRPFLQNVVRGKRVPPERVEEVARQYESFGGVSPLPAVTRRQAAGVRERLAGMGIEIPVHVGMRNWHPFLAEALGDMARSGVRRAIGFIAAPHHSYASCGQYRENVRDALRALRQEGLPPIEITYVDSWYDHPVFVRALADRVREALERLDEACRASARFVFTAHSIPVAMAQACRYQQQLLATAGRVAAALGRRDWVLVYQSRSGRPEDHWLEPDVCDYLRRERDASLQAVVLVPIGFVVDHIEVLVDLDRRAGSLCRELDLPVARAATLNDDPLFLDVMADVIRRTWDRGRRAIPLPVTAR